MLFLLADAFNHGGLSIGLRALRCCITYIYLAAVLTGLPMAVLTVMRCLPLCRAAAAVVAAPRTHPSARATELYLRRRGLNS